MVTYGLDPRVESGDGGGGGVHPGAMSCRTLRLRM